jgi:hypothetical protein
MASYKINNNWAITSDAELRSLSDQLNIQLDGILDLRNIQSPLPKTGSYLVLLRDAPGTGHWVAVHDGLYFDSMGCEPPEILNIDRYNDKQYQGSYNMFCGVWCLLFLYSKQKNRPELLDGFTDLNVDVYVSK